MYKVGCFTLSAVVNTLSHYIIRGYGCGVTVILERDGGGYVWDGGEEGKGRGKGRGRPQGIAPTIHGRMAHRAISQRRAVDGESPGKCIEPLNLTIMGQPQEVRLRGTDVGGC